MAYGSGKYGELAITVQELTQARAVVVAVIGGDKGHGFEVVSANPSFDKELPALLRGIADEIEHDRAKDKN
jgi:hypothetical protein